MSSNAVFITLSVVGVISLLVVLSMWSRAKALTALRGWAQAEGFELISATSRSIVPLWCSGRGYQFFRVAVRGEGGLTRRAWVRCLDFNSAEPHNVEVTWDEKSTA